MEKFCFYDHGKRDFLRKENGDIVIVDAYDHCDASEWLQENGEKYGWTNQGTDTKLYDDIS
jgi:hypothetical protein